MRTDSFEGIEPGKRPPPNAPLLLHTSMLSALRRTLSAICEVCTITCMKRSGKVKQTTANQVQSAEAYGTMHSVLIYAIYSHIRA